MEVSAFLSTEESNMELSKYEIVVKSACNDQGRVITALGLPKIYSEKSVESNRSQDIFTEFTVSKPSTFGQY